MKKFVTARIKTNAGTFYCNFKSLSDNEQLYTCNGRTLYQCYARPSVYKVRAYEDCIRIVHQIFDIITSNCSRNSCEYYQYGIPSYNTNIFTFNANFYKDNNVIARLHCTNIKTEIEIADEYISLFNIEYIKRGC